MEQGNVFRLHLKDSVLEPVSLNPFGTGQCLSTSKNLLNVFISKGLNPFGTGQCLSTRCAFFLYLILRVSIPLEQGSVFRLATTVSATESGIRLNPFGTGQCLSTDTSYEVHHCKVSIPLEQGSVFRLQRYAGGRSHAAFQTHFPIFWEG